MWWWCENVDDVDDDNNDYVNDYDEINDFNNHTDGSYDDGNDGVHDDNNNNGDDDDDDYSEDVFQFCFFLKEFLQMKKS